MTCGSVSSDYFAAHAPISFEMAVDHLKLKGIEEPSYERVMKVLAQMRWHYAREMVKQKFSAIDEVKVSPASEGEDGA